MNALSRLLKCVALAAVVACGVDVSLEAQAPAVSVKVEPFVVASTIKSEEIRSKSDFERLSNQSYERHNRAMKTSIVWLQQAQDSVWEKFLVSEIASFAKLNKAAPIDAAKWLKAKKDADYPKRVALEKEVPAIAEHVRFVDSARAVYINALNVVGNTHMAEMRTIETAFQQEQLALKAYLQTHPEK